MSETESNVQRLRRLDCCAVSDALDKLQLAGTVTGLPQRSGAGRIAGRAITVKLGTGAPPPGPVRHLGCTAIEQAGPDNIIVVEQRTGVEAGSWGGLLSLGAKVRGVAGVVADGPVRDIDEALDFDFPVFSRALTAFTARSRVVEQGTNVPVQIGNVTVEEGDYVVADRSAVIFIAARDIARVLETAEAIVRKESVMAKAILGGTPIGEVMGGNYEHMLKG
ncbi:RraA family protein [Cupriavidus neocaledonicus]|uniref:Putative 4-hydroxy-4-methyl-2-oxoglutarate aldolase n=1 Tax=Cupriavidus neocaledonicus TaxID=1040979 RepID=A0A375HLM3_9BURK|nr:dimethylmenaquinone methyltransferase [Cupriavidus neocaledonicus]SOZ39181.1 Dimethylmenaquinone methyltransferase [Cupriavidus neocaledonicus]SPD59148.1 Dimethylmenaquinone methyltransferase [Cupriavidus neocaledonicus]